MSVRPRACGDFFRVSSCEMQGSVNSAGTAFGIDFCDRKEQANAHEREVYPQAVKKMEAVVEGTPRVRRLHVSTTTFRDPTAPTESK